MSDGFSSHKQQKREEKRRKSVEKAIPNIADAVKTVVSLSKNEDFKKKCFELIKAKDDEELCEVLKKKLWKIASCSLNVQPSKEYKSQIVPDEQPSTDKAVKTTVDKKNAVDEGGGEDFFDDLAKEMSFYEDPATNECPQVTTKYVKHRTDSLDLSKDSCFELLAELHWDLSEEYLPSGVKVHGCKVANRTAHPWGCTSKVQEKKQNSVQRQQLQCSMQEEEKSSFPLQTITDFTSPKAKLRCHEKTLTPKEDNDWLQEFTQDSFWLADMITPRNVESEPPLMTSKEKVKVCGVQSLFNITSSGCVNKDDFDDLAEL